MKIRKIEVDRFRGIQNLDWDVRDYFICLVGPCESTKSTILDAIDLALSTRWNVQFDDTDLHHGNTDQPTIKITSAKFLTKLRATRNTDFSLKTCRRKESSTLSVCP